MLCDFVLASLCFVAFTNACYEPSAIETRLSPADSKGMSAYPGVVAGPPDFWKHVKRDVRQQAHPTPHRINRGFRYEFWFNFSGGRLAALGRSLYHSCSLTLTVDIDMDLDATKYRLFVLHRGPAVVIVRWMLKLIEFLPVARNWLSKGSNRWWCKIIWQQW